VLTAVLFLASVLACLVVFEAGLRLAYFGTLAAPRFGGGMMMPHPTRSFTLKPNTRSWHQELDFTVPVEVNSKGLRDRERDYGKSPGSYRVLLVADSGMFGSGVRAEEATPVLLEQRLTARRVEVINAGMPVYSTVQEYLYLIEEGLKFEPDLVLLAFSASSDIQTNVVPLQQLYQRNLRRPYANLDPAGRLALDLSHVERAAARVAGEDEAGGRSSWLTRRLVLGRLIGKAVKGFKRSEFDDPNIFIGWPFLARFAPGHSTRGLSSADYEQLWAHGWRVTRALIEAMRAAATAAGATFAMVVVPAKIQVEPEYQARVGREFPQLELDPERINREVAGFGAAASIPILDVLTDLKTAQRSGGAALFYGIEDEHMTARAHAIVAESLDRQLTMRNLIPDR
jgi:hypothetical protein